MALTAEQITVIKAGLDTSAFQVGANLAAASLKALADAGEPVIQSGERLKRNVIESTRAFERYAIATDATAKAAVEFTRIQVAATNAREAGRTTEERANQVLEFHRQRLGLVTAAEVQRAAGLAATTAKIEQQRAAIQAAADAQQQWNRWAGAQVQRPNPNPGVTDYQTGLARAGRMDDLEAFGRALDALESKVSPLLRAMAQYRQSLADIAEAEKLSADAADQAATAREAATEQLIRSLAANRQFLQSAGQSSVRNPVTDEALNRGLGAINANYDPIAKQMEKIDVFMKQLVADAKLTGMSFEEIRAATEAYRQSLGILSEAQIKAQNEAKKLKDDQEAAKRALDLRTAVQPSIGILEDYRVEVEKVGTAIKENLITDPAQAAAALERLRNSTAERLSGNQQFMDTYRPGTGSAVEDQAFAKGLADMRAQLIPAERETQQLRDLTEQLAKATRLGAVSWTEAQEQLAKFRAGMKGATEDDKLFAMTNEEVRTKTDSLFRVSKDYEAQLNLLNEAQRRGLVVGGAYDRELDSLNKNFAAVQARLRGAKGDIDDGSNSIKSLRVALEQLGLQSIDIFQGFASGQPVFRTLVQQLGQVGQVMLIQNGISETWAKTMAFLRSTAGVLTVGLTALTAVMVAAGSIAEAYDRRLGRMRTTLSGVTDEWNKMADAQEKASRISARGGFLSTSQAQAGAGQLFGTGEFFGDPKQAADVLDTFERFSRVLGDTEVNWQRMRDAMRDPAAFLQQMLDENHLKGINPELIRMVRNLQEGSNRTEAFSEALRIVRNASGAANDNLTPLEQSLQRLRQSFYGSKEGGESMAVTLGRPLAAGFGLLIDNITALIDKLNALGRVLSNLVPQWMIDWANKPSTPDGDRMPSNLTGQIQWWMNRGQTSAPGIMPSVIANASRQQVDPDLLARLQRSEGVLNRDGTWQDSTAGAVGPMQVKPETFSGIARQHPELNLTNVRDVDQNMAAGAAHFGDLLAKYGDPRVAILAYHQGEPTIDAIIAKGGRGALAGNSQLRDALAQADKVMAGYSGSPTGLIGERGGAPTYRGGMPTESTLASREGGVSGTGFQADIRDAQKAEEEYRKQLNSVGDQITDLILKQKSLQTAREQAATAGDTEAYKRIGSELEAVQGQLYKVLTPQQVMRRELELQNQQSNATTEGTRKLVQITEQLNEIDRQHPETASAAERAKIIQEALKGQSQEYATLRREIDEQLKAQDRLGEGYAKSYTQAQIAEARTKALADSLRLFPEGSDLQKAAVEDLTKSYLSLTKTTQETEQAQRHLQSVDTLTYTNRETELVTESNAAREYKLSLLKQEQEIRQRLASAGPEAIEQALTDARKQANAELERTSAGYRVFIRDATRAADQQDRLATATRGGYREAEQMTARIKAENDAFNLFPDRTSKKYLDAVENMTKANLRLADSMQKVQAENEGLQNKDTLAYQREELQTLGQDSLARDRLLGQLKNEQDVRRQYHGLGEQVIADRLKERNAILDQEIELKRLQGALDEVANSLSSSFDTIGNSITQALVSGQGAAVNWKNVMNSVAQQVLQTFLKLAILNPLLNSLFGGQHRSTLGDVFDALSAKENGSLGSLMPGSQSVSQEGGMGGGGAAGWLGKLVGWAGGLFGLASGGGAASGASQSPFGDTGSWDVPGGTSTTAANDAWDTTGPTSSGSSSQDMWKFETGPTGNMLASGEPEYFARVYQVRHGGGLVGFEPPAAYRYISDRLAAEAPRFHTGLNSDEFAAILQKGERVLTAQQDRSVSAIVGKAANDTGSAPAPVIQFNITTPDADSFRRSQQQIMGQAASALMQTRRRLAQR